jgi:hypothetical protein
MAVPPLIKAPLSEDFNLARSFNKPAKPFEIQEEVKKQGHQPNYYHIKPIGTNGCAEKIFDRKEKCCAIINKM